MTKSIDFEFDEDSYLLLNPDVADAVKNHDFPNGRAHYELFGKLEGRQFASPFKVAQKGLEYALNYDQPKNSSSEIKNIENSRLYEFFKKNDAGPGIWKWLHYFSIYESHLSKFVGKEVHFLEIGVYSGGSLKMWRDFFGPKAYIYGVDIMPECKVYEDDRTKIFIGDQADPDFWENFKKQVPSLDVCVDDGGHSFLQQVTTLKALLPHIRGGGIFLCEDVQGSSNQFSDFCSGMIHGLNASENQVSNSDSMSERLVVPSNNFMQNIKSINFYPFIVLLEKNDKNIDKLVASKKGTHWQPFLT
jgi:hypothetical protein